MPSVNTTRCRTACARGWLSALRVPSSSIAPRNSPDARSVPPSGSTSRRSAERLAHLRVVRGQRRLDPGVVLVRVLTAREAHQSDPSGARVEAVEQRLDRGHLGAEHAVAARDLHAGQVREPGRVLAEARRVGRAARGVDHEHDVEELELALVRERPAGQEPEPRHTRRPPDDVDRIERERDLGNGSGLGRRAGPTSGQVAPRAERERGGERPHPRSVLLGRAIGRPRI